MYINYYLVLMCSCIEKCINYVLCKIFIELLLIHLIQNIIINFNL